MLTKFIIVLLFVSSFTYADEKEVKQKFNEYTKRVQEHLDELRNLKAEDFFKNVDRFRDDIDQYIDQKKRVCQGDFSLVILGDSPLKDEEGVKSKKAKLSANEKELCLGELKALQMTYINNMFLARKKYLDYLHDKRVEELTLMREEALTSLRQGFEKKN
jgi:hypothetical protein